jgi:hypothetical protein
MMIETGFKMVKCVILLVRWLLIAIIVAIAIFYLWVLWFMFFSPPLSGIPG